MTTSDRVTGRVITGLWHGFNRSGVKTLHGFVQAEGHCRVFHAELGDATRDLERVRGGDTIEMEIERRERHELHLRAAHVVTAAS